MRLRTIVPALAIVFVCTLSSCSGQPKNNGGGGGGTGNLPLSMTLSAIPAGLPSTISILSFTVTISGVTITSQTNGALTNLSLTNLTVDLNKLLADTAFLGQFSLASDQYSKIQVAITNSQVVYCTSTSGVAGCTSGTIASVNGGPGTLTFTYSPALSVTTPGIGVRFRISMSNALVLNSGGTAVQSIDFSRSNVAFSEQLPRAANLSGSQLDYVDNVTGLVTQVGSSSITIQTATAGTITANVTATANFSAQNCAANSISCAQVGQVADMDTILNADGSFTLLLFDPFSSTSSDWIEGVISQLPSNSSQFSIVVTNFVAAQTSSLISGKVHLGDQVTLTLASSPTFAIDQKNLTIPANSFAGAQDTSVLFPDQVVAVRVTAFTAASGTTAGSASVNFVLLRFSTISGTAVSSGPNFTFTPTPPFLGITGPAQTRETTGATLYDLSTSGTSLGASQPTGISALYIGQPSTAIFVVSKVRQ